MRPIRSNSAIAILFGVCVWISWAKGLSGCTNERVIRVSNNTDDVLVNVQVRHRAETTHPVSIAPKAFERIRLPWDDRDPYELVVSHGGAVIVVGQCRVLHRWVDGLTIRVASVAPPQLECYEQG